MIVPNRINSHVISIVVVVLWLGQCILFYLLCFVVSSFSDRTRIASLDDILVIPGCVHFRTLRYPPPSIRCVWEHVATFETKTAITAAKFKKSAGKQ